MIKCSICNVEFDGELSGHIKAQHVKQGSIDDVIHYLAFLEKRIKTLEDKR